MTPLIELLGGVRASVFAGLFLGTALFAGVQTLRVASRDAALAKAEQKQVALERSYQKSIYDKVYTYHEKLSAADQRADQLADDLRTSKRKLRDRFTCPATLSEGGAGGTQRGLLGEDGVFLVREAQRADEVVRQLQLCQEDRRQLQLRWGAQ